MRFIYFILLLVLMSFSTSCVKKVDVTSNSDLMSLDTSKLNNHWEKVAELSKLGHLKEEAKELQKIIDIASANKLMDHEVLATFLIAKITEETTHNVGWESLIPTYQNLVKESTGTMKALNQIILANLYLEYGERNAYRTVRSGIERETEGSYKDWSLGELQAQAFSLFRTALEEPSLKQVKIEDVQKIMGTTENAAFSPTLYDVMAQMFISQYSRRYSTITSVSSHPIFESEDLFADRGVFIELEIPADTTDSDTYVLHFIQEYYRYLEHQGYTELMAKVELDRLARAMASSQLGNSAELYMEAIQRMLKEDYQGEARRYIMTRFLEIYSTEYDFPAYKEDKSAIDALFLDHRNRYEEIMKEYEGDRIASFAKAKREEEAFPEIRLKAQDTYGYQSGVLLHIEYKNVDKLDLHLRKLENNYKNHSDFRNLYGDEGRTEDFMKRGKTVYQTSLDLPVTPSYKRQSAEFNIPGHEYGLYILEVRAKSIYGEVKLIETALFQVSDMQALTIGGEGMQVLDRKNGVAIKNADVRIYDPYLKDYKKNVYSYENKTDKNGLMQLKGSQNYRSIVAEITHGDDIYVTERFYEYTERGKPTFRDYIRVFTDRSIYRPGQVVYFKAVLGTGEGVNNRALKNETLTFSLYDANGQEVASMPLTSDEYGAVTGSFALPSSGLPGRYSIRTSGLGDYHYISVEEYKRPKFHVEIDKPDTRLTLGERTVISGEAMAYAGYPIASANVRLTVNRREFYYPYYYFFMPRSTDPGRNILEISLTTDENGKFSQEIEFEASALEKKQNKIFYYDIRIQVVDQAGESHNADMSLVVGTRALRVDVRNLADHYSSEKEVKFELAAQNSIGTNVATSGTIRIAELETPEELKYPRLWEVPDTVLIAKEEFERDFPHLNYTESRGPLTWKEKRIVSTEEIELGKVTKRLQYALEKGLYKVTVTLKDAEESEFVFQVDDPGKAYSFQPEMKLQPDKETYEAGDRVSINVLRPESWYAYTMVLDKWNNVLERKVLLPGQSRLEFALPDAEEDVQVQVYSMNHARFHYDLRKIRVLNKNHRYQLEVVEIDDPVKPGEKLRWTFRLVDADGKPVQSAGFATLYDKSLDALKGHEWNSSLRRSHASFYTISSLNRVLAMTTSIKDRPTYYGGIRWYFPDFEPILDVPYYRMVSDYAIHSLNEPTKMMKAAPVPEALDIEGAVAGSADALEEVMEAIESIADEETSGELKNMRENLNELVFFNGDIRTDENGEFTLDFTMNDALTEWKLMLLTHDKELFTASLTETVVTQKNLMIQEQFPRFFREKDRMSLKATIIRTDREVGIGVARLDLKNALTGESVNQLFGLDSEVTFEIEESGQAVVSWEINAPGVDKAPMVEFVLSVEMGAESDAVSGSLPLVTNRKFITEAIPLFVGAESKKEFQLRNYEQKAASGSLENYAFRLDYVPNPVWEAIKAMPAALSEERIVSSLMENYMIRALAMKIIDENPQIKPVFEQWARDGDLQSNLSRKQELKIEDLEETPWVRAAQSQTDRMQRIAHLFNLNQLAVEQQNGLQRLARAQKSDGGWPWIEGGNYSSWYVSMMVLDYFADLRDMRQEEFSTFEQNLIDKAIKYIDAEFMEHWNKYLKDQLNEDRLISGTVLQYLSIRSLYANKLPKETAKALDKVADKLKKDWMKYSVPSQVYIGLGLRNYDKDTDLSDLYESIHQQLVKHDEMGAYYKGGFYFEFYAQSVPLTAAMMKLFDPVENYLGLVDEFKVFLLSNKRTNDWGQSSASMKAIYGLLYYGDPIVLDSGGDVKIEWGGESVSAGKEEAGTGAFSITKIGTDMDKADYSTVSIDNKSNHISWGGLYWQYFEDMDKVQGDGISEEFPISIAKNFYRTTQGDNGPVLRAIKDGDVVKVGDEITVQINIRVDRSMDFVHVKDDRIAGTEPLDVLSGHQFKYGLYYYQVTRDISSDFYFSTIRPGQYNLEYSVVATHEGTFSAGLAQAQSYYAPEFGSHSEGRRIVIENK